LGVSQRLTLAAVLVTPVFSVSLKQKMAVCAATTAILLGEKLYNNCHHSNHDKKADYRFSKCVFGFVGIAATYASKIKLSVVGDIGVLAASAIICPIPLLDLQDNYAYAAGIMSCAMLWAASSLIPKNGLISLGYLIYVGCSRKFSLDAFVDSCVVFGDNILKSFGMDRHFVAEETSIDR
jgi:hypothetical protein